jgi:hypothetical protein
LSLIHQDPGHQWTLASLAEAAGMSRATLGRRFQDLVGIAPMSYIANWRLSKAYKMYQVVRHPAGANCRHGRLRLRQDIEQSLPAPVRSDAQRAETAQIGGPHDRTLSK